MTNPFDQLTTLAKANRKLGPALLEVARASTQRQVEINGKALTTSADRVKAVADEWQESTQGLVSPAAGQKKWALTFEAASKLITPFQMTGAEKSHRASGASPAKEA